jgi:hypothetical protein
MKSRPVANFAQVWNMRLRGLPEEGQKMSTYQPQYIHTWPVLTYAQQWEIRFHIWRLYVLRENDADYDAWRAWSGLP